MFNLLAAGSPMEHVQAHDLFMLGPIHFNNHMLMASVAAILMLIIFPLLFGRPIAGVPRGAGNFFEAILEFLRVEVFRPALKEKTDRFVPFLWTLFFFILFCNLLGVIPTAEFLGLIFYKTPLAARAPGLTELGGSATGNINTTGVLAACVFLFIHLNGIWQVYTDLRHGTYGHHEAHEEHSSNGAPGHEAAVDLDHMRAEALPADVPQDVEAVNNPTQHYMDDEHIPHAPHSPSTNPPHRSASLGKAAALALPLYLWNFAPHPFRPAPGAGNAGWFMDVPFWAFLLILELVGALIKPVVLAIRLFANMIAGHLVLAILIGLIVMVPSYAAQTAIFVPMALLSLLIWVLEIFVAFLQAYIFTFLATLFVASAVAPEH